MKCFPLKIVSLLIVLILVHLIELVLLAIVCDNSTISKLPNADILTRDHVRISRLVVDTIYAEEIEIFPLMDFEGNIVK